MATAGMFSSVNATEGADCCCKKAIKIEVVKVEVRVKRVRCRERIVKTCCALNASTPQALTPTLAN